MLVLQVFNLKKQHWAILLAILYLVVYTLLVDTSANMLLLSTLFSGSSIMLIWIVIAILKRHTTAARYKLTRNTAMPTGPRKS